MRAPRACLLVIGLAAALGSPARAAEVRAGQPSRVVRPPTLRIQVALLMRSRDVKTASVMTIGAAPADGDVYDVVNERGWVGRIRVEGVGDAFGDCAGLYHASAAWMEPPPGPIREPMFAIGPSLRGGHRARGALISGGGDGRRTSEMAGLPEEIDGRTVIVIDLDGDNRADFVRYIQDLSLERGQLVTEDHTRARGDQWKVVEHRIRCAL